MWNKTFYFAQKELNGIQKRSKVTLFTDTFISPTFPRVKPGLVRVMVN